jgi:CRP-like cAMP-binding protein
VSADYRHAKVLVRHNVSNTHILNESMAALRNELDRVVGDKLDYSLTGESLMINKGAESLVSGQLQSLLLLIAVIYTIMSFLFTSMAAGLVSLVPNLVPLILNFGTMGLLGIPLNPGTALVAAIAMGIAIDDTSHLMLRYNDECRKNPDQERAIHATVRAEATPVISTSIGLAAMFATLIFSSFENISQFGLLAAATMIYAMIADLLITPLMLKRVRLVGVWELVTFKMGTQVLLDSPIFRGMSPKQIRKAILLSNTRDVDIGEIVILEGTKGREMYLLLSGEVEVLREQAATKVRAKKATAEEPGFVKVATLQPGEVFGEIGFVGDTLRTATVRATKDSTLLVFSAEGKNKALRLYPRIEARLNQNISRTISERFAEVTRRSSNVSH